MPSSVLRDISITVNVAFDNVFRKFLYLYKIQSTGCFFHWYPPKNLKYGKPRLGESTLTQIGLDTPNLAQINFFALAHPVYKYIANVVQINLKISLQILLFPKQKINRCCACVIGLWLLSLSGWYTNQHLYRLSTIAKNYLHNLIIQVHKLHIN